MQHTTPTSEADEVRGHLHGMWSAVAPAWGQHADYADSRATALTERLLALADPGPNERVLELACGPGGLGLAVAEHVPGGEVVLSDVAPEMVEIAARRARERGLANVSTAVIDLEAIDAPDASFDAVVCREGLMFAVDPGLALREIHRVLAPGGRFAAAVWGPRAANPWLGTVLDAASAHFGAPMPPPGIPGPFALDDARRLEQLVRDAGFTAGRVEELAVPTEAAGFEEWWSRTTSLAGPLEKVIAGLPEAAAAALRDRAREAVAPYASADGALTFPGLTLIATGRR
jgi:ubiquinone/menaquinone biosynthesis C-methylase UbiE